MSACASTPRGGARTLGRMVRNAWLWSWVLLVGCHQSFEAPRDAAVPDAGPCGTWTVGPDGVLSAWPTARFVRTGGPLVLRSLGGSHDPGGVSRDDFWGDLENVSGDVVCTLMGTLRIDGAREARVHRIYAPPYDVGAAESVACLGPGERGVFRASTFPASEGPDAFITPLYERVEYRFEGEVRTDAVPHALAPTLLALRPAEDVEGIEAELSVPAGLQPLEIAVAARDACGQVNIWFEVATSRAEPPGAMLVSEGERFVDPTERGYELLPFAQFTVAE